MKNVKNNFTKKYVIVYMYVEKVNFICKYCVQITLFIYFMVFSFFLRVEFSKKYYYIVSVLHKIYEWFVNAFRYPLT